MVALEVVEVLAVAGVVLKVDGQFQKCRDVESGGG